MARGEGLYSRAIAWLKILLPLAALALLSTLFLFSRSTEPLLNVPFADALQSGEALQQQVSAPYYAGTTQSGDTLTMTARSARPTTDGMINADELAMRLLTTDHTELRLNAREATLRDTDQTALLQGGVEIESSAGYSLQTEAMTAAIDRVEAETQGKVTGQGPVGTLEAGKLRVEPAEEDGDLRLLFTDGVKLIYHPQKQ